MPGIFVTALAESGVPGAADSFDLTSIMQAGVNSVQQQVFLTLGLVVPAIVGIYGVVIAVKFGLRWLKKLGQG